MNFLRYHLTTSKTSTLNSIKRSTSWKRNHKYKTKFTFESKNQYSKTLLTSTLISLLFFLQKSSAEEEPEKISGENSSDESGAKNSEESEENVSDLVPGEVRSDLPFYSIAQIAEHNSMEKGIWVYFSEGVYDITSFVEQHPGGKKILMAAGSSVEPFWALYGQHMTVEVQRILEGYRIGNLEPGSVKVEVDRSDPYCNDPVRFPGFLVHSQKPFNSEVPLDLILDNFVTPNEMFYVRNHLPVPVIEPSKYRLTVGGNGFAEKVLTLDDIKYKYPKHDVMATIQCAGNRRSEMNTVKKVRGLEWEGGAISNAVWGGALLRDVLLDLGYDEKTHQDIINHIHLEGYDTDNTRSYGGSIPIGKGVDKLGDVLLAYEMNGAELPRDHGFPIRIVVPGYAGARNVKWLKNIYLSHEESHNHWQRNDYKGFSPGVDWETVDYTTAPSIEELPVQSAICSPPENAMYRSDDHIPVNGYAWSGGGKSIIRVDVSFDGGETWKVADLRKPNQMPGRTWAWTFWEIDLDIPADVKDFEIVCKAIDSQYNTQPGDVSAIWNLRGVLSNPWDRVKVKIQD